jgi:hypothetical protein
MTNTPAETSATYIARALDEAMEYGIILKITPDVIRGSVIGYFAYWLNDIQEGIEEVIELVANKVIVNYPNQGRH